MMTSVVLTFIGPDRPGLVSALSDQAAACGANWLESRMANFGGQFAGAVHLDVPEDKADALIAALRGVEALGLRMVIVRAAGVPAEPASRLLQLSLVGQDRPGIVRDISRVLAAHSVSIEELETEYESGSCSGENLFRASARLRVATGMEEAEVRRIVEGVANELMVDIDLDPIAARRST